MHSITINWNQVAWETYKAYLIKIPHSKFMFWIAKSYTQPTSNGKQLRLIINEKFEYKLFKENKIERKEEVVDYEYLLSLFGYEIEQDVEVIEDLKDE